MDHKSTHFHVMLSMTMTITTPHEKPHDILCMECITAATLTTQYLHRTSFPAVYILQQPDKLTHPLV